ncbi:hypothetical protein LZ318_11700 [Saccharopolyspora indica]|uniref:hypothetical protein n=1 Tax=Saccharopolyspora indica TaxID=1229659 RepID=UPI0022EA36C1|nr:hypothetical protein [Saccharopolyspora indica]MDA3643825.1 hypothetical protein [Saccharopolyspora indica]
MNGGEVEQLVDEFTADVFDAAEGVYTETMCGPAGCCGDLHGALQVAIRYTIKRLGSGAA